MRGGIWARAVPRWLRLAAAWLVVACTVVSASAHLLPKQNATVNLIDRAAFVVVSVPVSALPGLDRNGDGLASAAEIDASRAQIAGIFTRGIDFDSSAGRGTQLFAWPMPPQPQDPAGGTDYVVFLGRYDFPATPDSVTIGYRLFGTRADEQAQTIKVTHKSAPGSPSEVAVYTPDSASHGFFRGWLLQLLDFVRTGFEHIWGGYDHLLFLLTILVGGRGWRFWLGVTGTFTLAHSLTLSLAMFDVVRLPASLVEPAIAASIVLVAAYNLFARGSGRAAGIVPQLALVFACGLLHGLGFASALAEMLAAGTSRVVTLIGFNLGIELGQLSFAGALLGAGALLAALGRRGVADRLPQLASWIALVLGLALTVARVVG